MWDDQRITGRKALGYNNPNSWFKGNCKCFVGLGAGEHMDCMELKSKLGCKFQKPSGSKLFKLLKCERNHNLRSQNKRLSTRFLCGLANQALHVAHGVAGCRCSLELMCPEQLGTTTNQSVWRRLTAIHTNSPGNSGANLARLETPSGLRWPQGLQSQPGPTRESQQKPVRGHSLLRDLQCYV